MEKDDSAQQKQTHMQDVFAIVLMMSNCETQIREKRELLNVQKQATNTHTEKQRIQHIFCNLKCKQHPNSQIGSDSPYMHLNPITRHNVQIRKLQAGVAPGSANSVQHANCNGLRIKNGIC